MITERVKPKIKPEGRETTMRAIYEDEWWAIQEFRKFGPVVKFEVFKQMSQITPHGEIKRVQTTFNAIPGGDEVIIRFD